MATDYKYIGKNYTTPDLVAKVTGRAKYAEDYRAEGMLFVKLLLSPMPHARVVNVDASRALALPGVKAILRASDFPPPPDPPPPPPGQPPRLPPPLPIETALTDEPVYQGEPILAIAAVDETTAADAIDLINVDYEPLPFVVDPLDSLRPGGPNARTQGNVYSGSRPNITVVDLKWTDADFAEAAEGRLPMGEAPDEFVVGDIEEGFKTADLILDETILTQSTSHQPLETRTAMAYWQNGKVFMHCSTQSTAQTAPNVARLVGVEVDDVVVISEYTGGGFGSKIRGSHSMAIPALMAKKTGTPVMMRITREEEQYIGRARAGLHGRCKVGFRKDGRIVAMDLFTLQDNGPYDPQGDYRSAGSMASLNFQPETYRWRGISVLTNTPPRTSQRAPGGQQMNAILGPIMAKAAGKLDIDQVDLLRINAPQGKALYGPIDPQTNRQNHVTGANVRAALDKGAALFGWDEKKLTAGQRRGTKVRGVGVAVGPYTAGSIGFDGIAIIRPDGKVQVQSGIGNLGTESVIDCQRVYAEVLDTPWEQFEVVSGNTAKGLPWTCVSAGSQTVHAMTRAAHATAMDTKRKLQEVAAKALGGSPASYRVANGRVFGGGRALSFADAAKKAIEFGGQYDGHEVPDDINSFTKTSMKVVAGQGLIGVAKDTYPRDGRTHTFVAGFAEVEVDVETGKFTIVEYTAVGDVGTVLHPRNLFGQTFGGSMLGMGHALAQKWVYDKQYGVALARRFHHNKPPSIMDIPGTIKIDALNIPDPETPIGARGIGEPPVGAGTGAVAAALVSALGDQSFRRYPMTPDLLLSSIEHKTWQHDALTAHI